MDIVNYLVSGRIPEGWTKNDRDKFFTLSNSLSGMIYTYLSIVRTRFLGGVCLTMKLEVFSHFVMTKHVGGISVGRKLQLKSFNVVFIGNSVSGLV